jgi:hypothetical protein
MQRLKIQLTTGDVLIWESFNNIEAPSKLFNKLLQRTGSYIMTKTILRNEYGVFIYIAKN